MPPRSTRTAPRQPSDSSAAAIAQQAAELHRQALARHQAEDWDGAIAAWEAALELYAQLDPAPAITEAIAIVAANLGATYRVSGQYVLAIERLERAITLMAEVGKPLQQARIANNLGNVYVTLGDYTQAIAQFQTALATPGIDQDLDLVTTLHSNLGAAYLENGEPQPAQRHYAQSLEIATRQGDRAGIAHALTNLATHDLLTEQLAQARDRLQQSLALAQALGDRPLLATILTNLGLTYPDDAPQALVYQQQALAITRELAIPKTLASVLNNYAHAALIAQQFDQAEQLLNEAIATLEHLREQLNDRQQVTLFQTQERTYNLLQQVLIANNKPIAALEIAEWGRARTFANLLARHSVEANTVPQLVSAPPPSLDLIRTVAREQQATLVEYLLVPEDRPLTGRVTAAAIALHIWIVQPDGRIDFRKLDFTELLNVPLLIHQLHLFTLGAVNRTPPPPGAVRPLDALLRQLDHLLIEPIADLLPSNPETPVIVIPHQALFFVPFAALQNAQGTYLIEQHPLSIAPSIQTLALNRDRWQQLQRQPSSPPRTPLVIGNPIMPTIQPNQAEPLKEPLDPLPYAEQEAIKIAELLGTTPLVGSHATKTAVLAKAPQASVLHFATHGVTDARWGLESAIALGPTPDDAGWLTARELLSLQLPADLAVLSACNTGRGEVSADGIIGLVRSLAAAGVPSLVASLWSVPDASTADLMIAFYHHLQALGDRPQRKAIALRQAMLDLLSTHPAPRDWAGFILVGETS